MQKRNYDYQSQRLMSSLTHTEKLCEYAKKLETEAIQNSMLIKRLREQKEIDAIAQINRHIALLEYQLNQMKNIADRIYERMALKLLYTKESECSLH